LALATVVLGWPLERKLSELRVERNEASDAYLFNKASRDSKPHVQAAAVGANFKAEADTLRAEFARWHLYSLVLNLGTVLLVTVAMALAAQLPNSSPPEQTKEPRIKAGEETTSREAPPT